MKKVFLLLALAASTMTAMADSYHEAFVRYESQANTLAEQIKTGQQQNMLMMTIFSQDTTLALAIAEYLEDSLMAVVLDELEPYFRSTVSEQELTRMADWVDAHPQLDSIYAKQDSILRSENNERAILDLELRALYEGIPMPQPKCTKGMPADYKKAMLTTVWPNSGYGITSSEMVRLLTDSLETAKKQMDKAEYKKTKKYIAPFMAYLQKGMPVRYTNMQYTGGISMEEVKLLCEFFMLPGREKINEANSAVIKDGDAISHHITWRFIQWGLQRYPVTFESVKLGFEWSQKRGTDNK